MKHIFSFSKNSKKREMSSAKRLFLGSTLMIVSVFLISSFISYLLTGETDQSNLTISPDEFINSTNSLGKIGAIIGDFFIYKGYGISSIILPILIFLSSLHVLLNTKKKKISKKLDLGILFNCLLFNIFWIY